MKKFLILVVIMLFFGGFVSKEVAEYRAVKYQDIMNSRIPYEVVIIRHRVWFERRGLNSYNVFIAYSANNLRLTSLYKVENFEVVDCYRVSE